MCVAETAVAALRNLYALANFRQIGEQGFTIFFIDLRADRHFQHNVLAVRTGPVLAHAVAAALRLEVLLIAIVDQRVEAGNGLDDDVTASAAVAAIGPAELDEFLAPERHAAVSARARRDVNLGLVEKFHGRDIARRGAFRT